MPLAANIEIQDLAANRGIPLPNEYERIYFRPSVVGLNAVGKPFVQAFVLGDDPELGTQEFELTWFVLTDAELALLRSAWDGLTSQVCRFEDVVGAEHSVVRHPDQKALDATAVKVAGGILRWAVTLRLLETDAAYEV